VGVGWGGMGVGVEGGPCALGGGSARSRAFMQGDWYGLVWTRMDSHGFSWSRMEMGALARVRATCSHARLSATCSHARLSATCSHARLSATCSHARLSATCSHARRISACSEEALTSRAREHVAERERALRLRGALLFLSLYAVFYIYIYIYLHIKNVLIESGERVFSLEKSIAMEWCVSI
jgi:hypothetical protein